MMNREAFALYIEKMLEICEVDFHDDCNAVAALGAGEYYKEDLVDAVFATKSSTLTIKDAGMVVGGVSLKTTYDRNSGGQMVDVTNYQQGGETVDMPTVSSTIDLELDELSQMDFSRYAEKLLAEYNVSFEDYFSGEKKDYKRSDDHLSLVQDVFHGDMVGIHISKDDYYIGNVCFVSDFKQQHAQADGVAFDYTKVVRNTDECSHLLPDCL